MEKNLNRRAVKKETRKYMRQLSKKAIDNTMIKFNNRYGDKRLAAINPEEGKITYSTKVLGLDKKEQKEIIKHEVAHTQSFRHDSIFRQALRAIKGKALKGYREDNKY